MNGGSSGGMASLGRQDRKARRKQLKLELENVKRELQRVEVKLSKRRSGAGKSRKSEDGKRGVKRKSSETGGRSGGVPPNPELMSREQRRTQMLKERNRRVQSLWGQCATILKQVYQNRQAWPFHKPVDWKNMGIPDYPKIVKRPMDMDQIARKLGGKDAKEREGPREYKSPLEFRDDMRLIFDNCQLYNPVGSDVRMMGDTLSDMFEKKWQNSNLEGKFAMELENQKNEEEDLKNFQSYRGKPSGHSHQAMDVDPYHRQRQQASGGGAPKRPRSSGGGDDPNADMTFEDKRKLSVNLGMLPAEKLGRVVQIINEGPSKLDNDEDEEIELDIDKLDNQTLWKLNKYVNSCLKGAKKASHQDKIQRMEQQQEETARKLEDVNATLASRSAGGPSTDFSPVSSKRKAAEDKDSDSSDSESESAEGVGSDGDMKKNSSFVGDVTRVSTTRPQGTQPQILNDSGNREVTLKNASAWETLTKKAPTTAVEEAGKASEDTKAGEAGGSQQKKGAGAGVGSLWSEFQSREQQMKAREEAERKRKEELKRQDELRRQEEEDKKRREKAEAEERAKRVDEGLRIEQDELLSADPLAKLPERTEELRKLQKGGNILPMLGLKLIEHDEEEVDGEDGEGDAEEGEL